MKLHPDFPFIGLDYGSKMAGTTAIAYLDHENGLCVLQSTKKKDADRWIQNHLDILKAPKVYIDAPLSLPGSYYGKSSDFFYRKCDQLVGAMSPMFLGGLTARAMKLASNQDADFIETYPSALVNTLNLKSWYLKMEKVSLDLFFEKWKSSLNLDVDFSPPSTYHEMDAYLCWHSGLRDQTGQSITYGQRSEGIIIV